VESCVPMAAAHGTGHKVEQRTGSSYLAPMELVLVRRRPDWVGRSMGGSWSQPVQPKQVPVSMHTMPRRRTGECRCVDVAEPKRTVLPADTTFRPSGN
jgi:hypothetical protein